ncbi:MAG: RNA polymerase subunit sigma, partial [Chthoniobacterales bacterium]|nr:RNA polymerase subunit sigma [Chthoniobacterales bacterium]
MATHSKRIASASPAPKRTLKVNRARPSSTSKSKQSGPKKKERHAHGNPPRAKAVKAATPPEDSQSEAVPFIETTSLILASVGPGDIQGRIRELIKLAKDQGYLTFDDLNEALPTEVTDADERDAILTRLRRMEIDIIEASEVDRYKDGKKDSEEEEEEKPEAKLDILDDPVRMYLKQM